MSHPIQERRVIYMTAREWADVQTWADNQGLTASAFLRAAARAMGSLAPHPPKDQIDVAIARVEAGERSYRAFTPAPKPSQVKR